MAINMDFSVFLWIYKFLFLYLPIKNFFCFNYNAKLQQIVLHFQTFFKLFFSFFNFFYVEIFITN